MIKFAKRIFIAGAIVLLAIIIARSQVQRDHAGNYGRQDSVTAEMREYRSKLENAGYRLDDTIDALRQEFGRASIDARFEITDEIDNLGQKRDEIKNRLYQIDKLTSEEWRSFRAETDLMLNSIYERLHVLLEHSRLLRDGHRSLASERL